MLSARGDVFDAKEYRLIQNWYEERIDQATSLERHDGNYVFRIKTGHIYLVDPF